MQEPFSTLTLSDIRRLTPHKKEEVLENDLMFREFKSDDPEYQLDLQFAENPIRVNGVLCLFCLRGEFLVDVNLKTYQVQPNSVLIILPNSISRLYQSEAAEDKGYHFLILTVSRPFLNSFNVKVDKPFHDSIQLMKTPVITLDAGQKEIFLDYFDLIVKVVRSKSDKKRDIIGPLLTSMTCLTTDMWKSYTRHYDVPLTDSASERQSILFDRFISLVSEYSDSQHRVAFYAEKLNLSPKYLSKLIKQASGRSAPEWTRSSGSGQVEMPAIRADLVAVLVSHPILGRRTHHSQAPVVRLAFGPPRDADVDIQGHAIALASGSTLRADSTSGKEKNQACGACLLSESCWGDCHSSPTGASCRPVA